MANLVGFFPSSGIGNQFGWESNRVCISFCSNHICWQTFHHNCCMYTSSFSCEFFEIDQTCDEKPYIRVVILLYVSISLSVWKVENAARVFTRVSARMKLKTHGFKMWWNEFWEHMVFLNMIHQMRLPGGVTRQITTVWDFIITQKEREERLVDAQRWGKF